eukprot:g4150.t1
MDASSSSSFVSGRTGEKEEEDPSPGKLKPSFAASPSGGLNTMAKTDTRREKLLSQDKVEKAQGADPIDGETTNMVKLRRGEMQGKLRKKELRRQQKYKFAVDELVRGEDEYINRMEFLCRRALLPKLDEEKRKSLGFVDLGSICVLGKQIVDTLRGGPSSVDVTAEGRPGYAFDRYFAHTLTVYRDYCIQQPQAAKLVKKWQSNDSSLFSNYDQIVVQGKGSDELAESKLPTRMFGTTLLAALMQPVQRCMRYSMLLKRILDASPPDSRATTSDEKEIAHLTSAIAKIKRLCALIDMRMEQPKLAHLYVEIEKKRPGTMSANRRALMCRKVSLYGREVECVIFSDAFAVLRMTDCETEVDEVVKFVDFSSTKSSLYLLSLHDSISCRVIKRGRFDRFTLSFSRYSMSKGECADALREFLTTVNKVVKSESAASSMRVSMDLAEAVKEDEWFINVPRFEKHNGVYYYDVHVVPSQVAVATIARERYVQDRARGVSETISSSNAKEKSPTLRAHGWMKKVRFREIQELIHAIRDNRKDIVDPPTFDDSRSKLFSIRGESGKYNARQRKDRIGDFLDACGRHKQVKRLKAFVDLVLKPMGSKKKTGSYDTEERCLGSIAVRETTVAGRTLVEI